MLKQDRSVESAAATTVTAPQATDAYLATIVRVSSEAIIGAAGDGTIQSWNPAAERIFGYTAAEAVGQSIALLAPPGYEPEQQAILASLHAGQATTVETVRRAKDGRAVHVLLNAAPVSDAAGQLVLIATTLTDLTPRKRAEAERQHLVALAEGSTDFIGICDLAGTPFYLNQAALDLVGLDSFAQAYHTPVREFFFPEDQAYILDAFFPAVLEHGHGEVEVRFRHFKTGAALWMLYRVFALTDADGRAVALATVSRDITERKQAEAALRASAERLRRIIDVETVGIIFFKVDGRITNSNRAFLRMSGYSQVDLDHGHLRWDRMTPPEYLPQSRDAIAEFQTHGRISPYEKEYLRKDGTRWWAVFAAMRLDDDTGVEFIIDITARKRAEAERERLLHEAEQARQAAEAALTTRDQFLSIASHELRTPLTPLLGYAGMLRQSFAPEAPQRKVVATIERQVQRLNRLIETLLDVSRLQRGQFTIEPRPLDLATVTAHTVDEFRLTLPAEGGHTITVEQPGAAIPVLGDAQRLEEVLQNLLSNGVKYSSAGCTIRVRVGRQDGEAVLEVADAGIGIPPEAQARLFEPFYRAANVGATVSGFGLGLYIVHEIVQRHGGRVAVDSIEGQGTTFRVVLPLQADAA